MATTDQPRVLAATQRSLIEYWHLFSLDAPTVAALWSYTFLRAGHLGEAPVELLLLALATWLLYAADRILDGMRPLAPIALRERHFFHARHRTPLIFIATLIALVAATLAATALGRDERRDYSLIVIASLGYFAVVHSRGVRKQEWIARWFPKEVVVGTIFAAAVAVPAWAQSAAHRDLILAIALFAALCWLNCVAIERWENDRPLRRRPPFSSLPWASRHVEAVSTLVAIAAVAAYSARRQSAAANGFRSGAIYLAVFLSAGILQALHHRRRRFSEMQLRIAADAALLTPLLVLPFLSR